MRYVAAYMLAVLGGKENPSTAEIERILSSVGVESDAQRVAQVCSQLENKNMETLISQGREKLCSMPAGAASAAAVTSAPADKEVAEKKEEKVEQKKDESESEDDDMGFGLFE